MKRILITGAGSYIGKSFENWMVRYDGYEIDTLDMQIENWKEYDFSQYDVVFHVAGIAHADVGKVSKDEKNLYYKINTKLTIETAEKAKKDGVGQFVFMSSMIVYGEGSSIGRKRVITRNTIPKPANFYGDSKLQAEIGILDLADDLFRVVVLRPPMIYGKGSKGNYPLLSKMAKRLPIFPKIENERSMLHIDNLCEFIRLMIENMESGIFFPQNVEYVNTSKMVQHIAATCNKKIILTKILNPIIVWMSKGTWKPGVLVNKAFGSIVYKKNMSRYTKGVYTLRSFEDSIRLTEQKKGNEIL